MGILDELIAKTVAAFMAAEFPDGRPVVGDKPVIAATGRIAPTVVESPLLRDQLAAAGVQPGGYRVFADPTGLLADGAWSLALVLSPFKRDILADCHRLGPDTREVTHTYQLFLAGLGHEAQKVRDGDYVLQVDQSYSRVPPVTATVFVNGTPLTTFLGDDRRQVVVTPLLKKGKNEIKVVAARVGNVIESNELSMELGGPAEYSPREEKFLVPPVKQFKAITGWSQDKKTGQWRNDAKPGSDTLERVAEFILDEEPKAKSK